MSNYERTYCTFFGAYGTVYTLSDKAGQVFYVGCTVRSMEGRLKGHVAEAKRDYNNPNASDKIKKIVELGFEFIATIVEVKWITGYNATWALTKLTATEKAYIKKYADLGCKLTNKECKPKKTVQTAPQNFVGQSFSVKITSQSAA